MGLALGEGGMARPNLGVRAPLFPRLPGIGGRSNGTFGAFDKGAGDDILGNGKGSRVLEDFGLSAFFPTLA